MSVYPGEITKFYIISFLRGVECGKKNPDPVPALLISGWEVNLIKPQCNVLTGSPTLETF